MARRKQCTTCWGAGKVTNRLSQTVECPTCKGAGYLIEKQQIQIDIEKRLEKIAKGK